MSRRPLIAANWKMHPVPHGALDKDSPFRERENVDVIVFPTYFDIERCNHAQLIVGGQAGTADEKGKYTGDISMKMLAHFGCRYVICGHSERRRYHHDTDEEIAEQVIAAIEAGLHPIICVGETAEERKAKKERKVIEKQLKLLPLQSDMTISYEPVWAVGTGKTATPEQAQEMHAFIRSMLPADRTETTRLLYGGSLNGKNAKAILGEPDIDGGLIGHASLECMSFREIVDIAEGTIRK